MYLNMEFCFVHNKHNRESDRVQLITTSKGHCITLPLMFSGRLSRMFPHPFSRQFSAFCFLSVKHGCAPPWAKRLESRGLLFVSMNDTSISSRPCMDATHCQSSLYLGRWCNFKQRTEVG